jgi:hypothetical protein
MGSIILAVLSLLSGLLVAYNNAQKEKAARNTPQTRAKDDEQKVNDAIAGGDLGTVNDEFNRLREAGGKAFVDTFGNGNKGNP